MDGLDYRLPVLVATFPPFRLGPVESEARVGHGGGLGRPPVPSQAAGGRGEGGSGQQIRCRPVPCRWRAGDGERDLQTRRSVSCPVNAGTKSCLPSRRPVPGRWRAGQGSRKTRLSLPPSRPGPLESGGEGGSWQRVRPFGPRLLRSEVGAGGVGSAAVLSQTLGGRGDGGTEVPSAPAVPSQAAGDMRARTRCAVPSRAAEERGEGGAGRSGSASASLSGLRAEPPRPVPDRWRAR